ncbi:unnamed protein product [Ceutorhynchus assimilis]|uniref:Uncharacterized protein n=1 Tax=Ceutorhynchus assimilis TaxID=467358 RepID=A0A9N9MK69_9CUCU|nr:unnamed protein product [Ceutorhynchus assimilis]
MTKKLKENKHKLAKRLRDFGEDYVSPKTKSLVPGKVLKQRCNSELCKKQSRQCLLVNEEQSMKIFTFFKQLGNLTRQREFITRHVKISETAQKTTKKEESRRQKSREYYLTVEGIQYLVCKTLFLNTFGISERTMRTSLEKVNSSGILEGEKRGGRQSHKIIVRDKALRDAIHKHIQRFPKIESPYCRSSSSKEYLHPELTVSKMYAMFTEELNPTDDKPSIDLYRKVFRSLNLSFHRPKKDQCSLCMTYKQGEEDVKEKLKDRYEKHRVEKNKEKALKENSEIACASFDLQQVIYLPQSRESALFYKRRLANYNFTVYDIASKECHCLLWSELESKRGASEVSSCVFRALQIYDSKQHIKSVAVFADGCSGQNKNSIIATMLLYAVSKTVNIEEISLYFFESFHGQNEGDSAHSAVSTALSTAGDIFIPAQLYPIIRAAVHCARPSA